MKILIFGASGSGTTTLGEEIEKRTDFIHLDADDFYWRKTEPPYQEKIPLDERNENLKTKFNQSENIVVSGSMVSWGKEWETAFDLAVFIRLENNERMNRLKLREVERYGEKLQTDKKIQQDSQDFLAWASQYENPNFNGRSLKIHQEWIKLLNCPVLTIDGHLDLSQKAEIVLNEMKNADSKHGQQTKQVN